VKKHFFYFLFLLTFFPFLLYAKEETQPESLPAESQTEHPSFWKEKFGYSGELRQETAYRIGFPKNFSKIKEFIRADLKFNFNDHYKLKIGGRAYYDAVYDLTDQFPPDVNDNMRKEGVLRDAYLDIIYPKIKIRLGHQQIVWGEALGQFFADVVTPKDLREFFLPSFDEVRSPIWALDVQYNFLPNANFEVALVPDQSVDKLALPGSDFAFFIPPPPPGVEQILLPDNRPQTNFKNWNVGARISYLVKGWDLAWLFYTAPDQFPTSLKTLSVDPNTGAPQITLDPVHKRVEYAGTTFNKDVGPTILRGEFVYTFNRLFNAVDITQNQGVIRRDQFRYVVGLDYFIGGKVLMNTEFQQEVIAGSTQNVSDPAIQTWIFFRFTTKLFRAKLIPEMVFVVGLEKGDTEVSPRIAYNITPSITLTWGADIFSGPLDTLYGEFNNSDRIFMNTRWSF
jgi:hypothetical protein